MRTKNGARYGKILQSYDTPAIIPIINDLQLAQLKKANFPRKGTWATDCVMLPMPIREGTRPYFPHAFPIFSGEGMALGMKMFKFEEIESAVPQAFMNLVETVQALPQFYRWEASKYVRC